jgi:VPDSG-CTERM motif
MRRLLVTCGLVLGFGFIAVPKASADVFSLNDIYCNCLPAGSTDGGTVTLDDFSGSNLQFTVDLNNLLNFHYTNAFDLFAFNFSGTGSLQLVSISGDGSTTGWTLDTSGDIKMDGAGQHYEFGLICSSCSATGGISGVNLITFTLSSTTGLNLDESMFETTIGGAGTNNNYFAASVTRTVLSGPGAGCTGVIGGGGAVAQPSTGTGSGTQNCGTPTVPDGGTTIGLLGIGMLALGFLRRRSII